MSRFLRRYLLPFLYALALMAIARPGFDRLIAAEPCTSLPRSGWISWLEVESRLREAGMRMVQLRINTMHCFDVTGLDAHGEQHLLTLHPVTGQILTRRRMTEPTATLPWRIGQKRP